MEQNQDQNKNPNPNLFDRFIEQFSARDLKGRVWAVVFLGFVLLGVAGAAGWWLLNYSFFVADEPGLQSVRFIDLLLKGM